MIRLIRQLVICLSLAALLFAGACIGPSDDEGQPNTKETTTLPASSPDSAVAAAASFAAEIPAAVGSSQPLSDDEPRVSPCTDANGEGSDDGPFSVHSAYRVALPGAQHRPALQRLRDEWKANGWTEVEYREFGAEGTRAELAGVSQDEHYDVRLTSGVAPVTFLRLLLVTPCYDQAPSSAPST